MKWAIKSTRRKMTGADVRLPSGHLVPQQVTVEIVDEDDPTGERLPLAVAQFEMREGAPTCTSLHFMATGDARGIERSDLEGVPLAEIGTFGFMRHAAAPMNDEGTAYSFPAIPETDKSEREVDRLMIESTSLMLLASERRAINGRRTAEALHEELATGVQDQELRNVARAYLKSGSRARAVAVQHLLGYPSLRTAERRIAEARKAGLIPPMKATAEERARKLEELNRTASVETGGQPHTMTLEEARAKEAARQEQLRKEGGGDA